MISTDVIYLDSTMAGTPTLSGVAGAAIDVLYAGLVTGCNPKTITITRSGQTATASCNNHGFPVHAVLANSGAQQAEYNGRIRVLSATANDFTFAVTGTPDTPATGTIEARFASAQWTRPYSESNIASFRMPVIGSAGRYLQVKDDASGANGGRQAFCRVWADMTDTVTGTEPCPTVAQLATGIVLNKSSTADATARAWFLRATPMGCMLGISFHASNPGVYEIFYAGDLFTDQPGDTYPTIISGSIGVTQTNPGVSNYLGLMTPFKGTAAGSLYKLRRGYDAVEAPIAIGAVGRFGNMISGGSSGNMPNPNPTDNGFHLSAFDICDTTTFLGRIGGLYQSLHAATSHPEHGSIVSPPPELAGHRLMVARINPNGSPGHVIIDLTGPDV